MKQVHFLLKEASFLKGVLAFLFFLAALCISFNEYRFAKEKAFNETLKGVIVAGNLTAGDASLDKKVILYSGYVSAERPVHDELYDFDIDAIVYQRDIKELTAWSFFSGRRRSYHPAKDEAGKPLSRTVYNIPVHMDEYLVDLSILKGFRQFTYFIPSAVVEKLRQDGKEFHIKHDRIYRENPREGVERFQMRFLKAEPDHYTIIALVDNKVLKRPTNFGQISYVFKGNLNPEEVIKKAGFENSWIAGGWKIGGFILLCISLMSSGDILKRIYAHMPFFDVLLSRRSNAFLIPITAFFMVMYIVALARAVLQVFTAWDAAKIVLISVLILIAIRNIKEKPVS